ncbi:hypothetical protein J4464_02800 [Candidatus Woesearchaeota archaeon]|nr:hypothetical protein [Candidatus Woesearchaeota archaeon]
MRGTLIYTYTIAYKKAIEKKRRRKDEAIVPKKRAPNYEEYFPKYDLLQKVTKQISGNDVEFKVKSFSDKNIVIEARVEDTEFDLGFVSKLRDELDDECIKIAKAYDPADAIEEYVFFCVKDFKTVDSFIEKNREKMVSLMKNEPYTFTETEVQESMKNQIRYTNEDLVVVDWDGAFVLDKEGNYTESKAIIEIANIQLLNLRILDGQIAQEVEEVSGFVDIRGIRRFMRSKQLLNRIIQIRTERYGDLEAIDKSLRLFGDWYTGKLYGLISQKLYLDKWRTSIEKRLAVIEDIYNMVSAKISEDYNILLELMIVLLIIFEILLYFRSVGS